MTQHTYLFEEGTWKARGVFVDEHGVEKDLEGKSSIEHRKDCWMLDFSLGDFHNSYKIEPFSGGRTQANWRSSNPMFGTMKGSFVVVTDMIVSHFHVENSDLHGTDCLLKLDDDTYRNYGVLFEGSRQMSSWTVELNRKEGTR